MPWTLLIVVSVILAAAFSGTTTPGTVLDDCSVYRGPSKRPGHLEPTECEAALQRQLAEHTMYQRPEWARLVLRIAGLPENIFK